MKKGLFEELLESVKQGSGLSVSARSPIADFFTHIYSGAILILDIRSSMR